MPQDLDPILHTEDCNVITRAYLDCHNQKPFLKYFGACNRYEDVLRKCFRRERQEKMRMRLETKEEKSSKQSKDLKQSPKIQFKYLTEESLDKKDNSSDNQKL